LSLLRLPIGRPLGLPDWPGCHCGADGFGRGMAVILRYPVPICGTAFTISERKANVNDPNGRYRCRITLEKIFGPAWTSDTRMTCRTEWTAGWLRLSAVIALAHGFGRRITMILREPSDGQERKQDSEDDPDINAHQSSPAVALPTNSSLTDQPAAPPAALSAAFPASVISYSMSCMLGDCDERLI
jgi:hypothetical protein